LLDLGLDVNARFAGDSYWDVAADSTPLHVAAWRAQHEVVKLLVACGASIDRADAKGRTPLALAVKACVDSYWRDRRSPASVVALLGAGASTRNIEIPTGYDEIDTVLAAARATEFGGVTPIFRVASMTKSRDYYVSVLGFKIDWEYPTTIAVYRDRCAIFLSEGDQGTAPAWAWVGVADVDALYEELKTAGAMIAQPPTNFEWACEMQVSDPDGNILRIGSDTKPGVPFGPWRDMHGKLWYRRDNGSWESSHQEAK
jgi:catechol 2,3-dioxygenase-like lactoylglutathione lyase family enzyme